VDLSAPLVLILGSLGARLLALAEPADAIAASGFSGHGRLRLFGLVLAGLVILKVYSRSAKLPFAQMADCFALPVLAGLAVVRVGCFLAGCCWGDLCVDPGNLDGHADLQMRTLPMLSGEAMPFAVTFPPGTPGHHQHLAAGMIDGNQRSLPVHPTQLYESGFLLLLALLLRWRPGEDSRPGTITLLALAAYALWRFGLEFLRADSQLILGPLTFTQMLCVVIGGFCAGWLGYRRKHPPSGLHLHRPCRRDLSP
jgi:phosphatidylglycerol:prolipoprotein diacylglycerol transferase